MCRAVGWAEKAELFTNQAWKVLDKQLLFNDKWYK